MIPERLLVHTVTVVAPTYTTDGYNAQVADYANGTRTELQCRIQQDSRAERYEDQRTPTEQVWTIFANVADLLRPDCRVEWAAPWGELATFETIGEPEPTYDGSGFHHIEGTLRLLEG